MADVALDDYIKTKHITRNSGRGGAKTGTTGRGGRARGGKAPQRSSQQNGALRANRFSGAIVKNTQRRSGGGGGANFSRYGGMGGGNMAGRWTHDLYGAGGGGDFMGAAAGLRSRGAAGAKLIISNLDYGVSENDIRDLFSELGGISRGIIHYDQSGRSLGTAEIIYMRPTDAVAALKKYNGVPLDGKPMEIQLVGGISGALGSGGGIPQRRSLGNGGARGSGRLGNGTTGRGRGGRSASAPARGTRGRRGGARGGGAGRTPKVEVTQEQLDMELEEYQSSANKMQT